PEGIFGSSTPGQVDRMKETFAELEKNIQLITFGSKVEPSGDARLVSRVYFEPQGSYAAWMAKAKPFGAEIQALILNDPYYAAAFGSISAQTNLNIIREALPEKMPTADKDKLYKDIQQLLGRMTDTGLVVSRGEGDKKAKETEITNIAILMNVDDA